MKSRNTPPETGQTPTIARERSRKRSTINDVARLADVSKKTVSRVINNSPFVKEETRAKVRAVIDEVGFVPDPQARGLAFRRSFLVGMVYDNPTPQYVVNMQQGILDAMRNTSFSLLLHPCDRADPAYLDDMRAFVERLKLFGAILAPSLSEDDRLARLLQEIGCPYIRVASVLLDNPAAMIVTHDSAGAAEAARHLAGIGHERIAYISGPSIFRSSHERRRGFCEALTQCGLKLRPGYDREGAYTFDSGIAAARELLSLNPRPTAIFAGNDEMAAGVYKTAHAMGIDIPRELSVVGYDDSATAERLWPVLTSVRLPVRDMGRLATEKLFGLKDKKDTGATEVFPKLMVRESTAPPAAQDRG